MAVSDGCSLYARRFFGRNQCDVEAVHAGKPVDRIFGAVPGTQHLCGKIPYIVTQKPQILNGTEKAEAFESLELRHVSFTYPFPEKNPKQVLSDVSFTVRKGEKIAIVGYNGAGKTTLTKLLMRLYDVTDGVIFITEQISEIMIFHPFGRTSEAYFRTIKFLRRPSEKM